MSCILGSFLISLYVVCTNETNLIEGQYYWMSCSVFTSKTMSVYRITFFVTMSKQSQRRVSSMIWLVTVHTVCEMEGHISGFVKGI